LAQNNANDDFAARRLLAHMLHMSSNDGHRFFSEPALATPVVQRARNNGIPI
jgi:hypothetical protein